MLLQQEGQRKKVGVPDTCVEDHIDDSDDEEEDDDQYESTYCATCGDDEGESEQQELWIACDLCDAWYHLSCEGLRSVPTDDIYICIRCQK